MKKTISLILALSIYLVLCACGSGSEGSNTSQMPEKTEATSEELAQAAELIKSAEDSIVTAAAHQLDGWTKYASIMTYYFVDSEWEGASGESSIYNRAKTIHNLRTDAQAKLDEAKALIGTNGTTDYYNAVKAYYKTVNVFWNLISEFPEGYSKLTYSSTVSDHKASCADAYAELDFYN